jgi:hypothetical protein
MVHIKIELVIRSHKCFQEFTVVRTCCEVQINQISFFDFSCDWPSECSQLLTALLTAICKKMSHHAQPEDRDANSLEVLDRTTHKIRK